MIFLYLSRGSNEEKGTLSPFREQDIYLPIANVARIMKYSVPQNGKVCGSFLLLGWNINKALKAVFRGSLVVKNGPF